MWDITVFNMESYTWQGSVDSHHFSFFPFSGKSAHTLKLQSMREKEGKKTELSTLNCLRAGCSRHYQKKSSQGPF